MATTTFSCSKDSRIAESGDLGAGTSDFNPIGLYSGYKYRTLLGFSYSFSGMVSITSAILHVRTSTQHYVAFGSDPDINVRRLSSSFSEGSSSGLSGSNSVTWSNQPGVTGDTATADITTSESTWDTIDITTMMQEALAAGVFYGLRLYAPSESSSGDVSEIYSREQGSSDPYITVTYTTNVAPATPSGVTPTGAALVAGLTPTLQATHVDADGDVCLKYDIQVSTDSTFATATHWNVQSTTGIVGNNIDRVYAGTALTRGTTYYFRFRTYSATGILTASPWSATGSFKVNRLPTVAFVTPSAVDANVELYKVAGSGVNPRMYVRWTYSDPDGAAQKTWQVTVQTDALGAFHTSAVTTSTATSYLVPVDVVRGAFYRVTVTVTDALGESATTGARRCKANWAVVEYRRDLGGVVTKWSAAITSAGGTNKFVVPEYASSAAGTAITTWYSSIGGAALNRWFHWRVWLFAWSGATTPSVSQMAMSYTTGVAVPPDGWTMTSYHSLDAGSRVYGTQSLKYSSPGGGVTQNAYQKVYVEPYTDYILSGRIKSDGDSGAGIAISLSGTGGAYQTSVAAGYSFNETKDWTAVKTGIWNSGANSVIYVRLYASGVAGAAAWWDALKMEASKVVTPWTPGFIGPALSVDSGGIQVDGTQGGILRLQGTAVGVRNIVELGTYGLTFGGDTDMDSPLTGMLRLPSGSFRSRRAAGTDEAFGTHEAASSSLRWYVRADGTMYWGPTSGSIDTVLYRGGANLLTTDDNFSLGGAGGGASAAGVLIAAAGSIDLYSANPFIDFKTSAVDYGARIIYDFTTADALEFVGAAMYKFDAAIQINSLQVVTARRTGWGVMTGTGARTAVNLETATIQQIGNRLKSLIDDLVTHGLIGP